MTFVFAKSNIPIFVSQSLKSNEKSIRVKKALQVKKDVDQAFGIKTQYAEHHCILNRKYECKLVWMDIKNLHKRSQALEKLLLKFEAEDQRTNTTI